MVRYVFSPQWFYGIDTIFEFLALITLLLIAGFCYFRYYKAYAIDSYKHFCLAFGSLSLAFFFKILTNIGIVYREITQQIVGPYVVTITSVPQYKLMVMIGTVLYSLYYFFFLIGLLILWAIVYKQSHKPTLVLLAFFALITTFFSHYAYFAFYMTSSLFLLTLFIKYWKNFSSKKQQGKGLLLALSFLILFFSHLIFIFAGLSSQFYVVAEIIQLAGFLTLLVTFILAVKS